MIILHLYRERFKSRKLFFIYGAEDMTLVNKSNSLLPVKRWSLNLPLRTFLQQLLYSCYQQWVSLTWITQVWGSCWPKPDRNQDVVLLKCKAETRESLRGPAEWHPHMDQSIVQVCKMHPHLKPFTFVPITCVHLYTWRVVPTPSILKVSILRESYLLFSGVTGTRSNLLLYSVGMDILASPQGSVFLFT